jgi:hypothetical protein
MIRTGPATLLNMADNKKISVQDRRAVRTSLPPLSDSSVAPSAWLGVRVPTYCGTMGHFRAECPRRLAKEARDLRVAQLGFNFRRAHRRCNQQTFQSDPSIEPACLVASRSEEELREPRRLSLEGRKVEVVES